MRKLSILVSALAFSFTATFGDKAISQTNNPLEVLGTSNDSKTTKAKKSRKQQLKALDQKGAAGLQNNNVARGLVKRSATKKNDGVAKNPTLKAAQTEDVKKAMEGDSNVAGAAVLQQRVREKAEPMHKAIGKAAGFKSDKK